MAHTEHAHRCAHSAKRRGGRHLDELELELVAVEGVQLEVQLEDGGRAG